MARERVLPLPRLAIRTIGTRDGMHLGARWIDDRTGIVRLSIVAALAPTAVVAFAHQGYAADGLAAYLALIVETSRQASPTVVHLTPPDGAMQIGLQFPAIDVPATLDGHATSLATQWTWTTTVLDPAFLDTLATLGALAQLIDQLWGHHI